MAGNVIEAKLRILTEAAQSIKELRELRREMLETKRAGAAGGAPGAAPAADATAAAQAAKEQAAAEKVARDAKRDAARQTAQAERETRTAQRQAAREQEAESAKTRTTERKANAERVRETQEVQRKLRAETNLTTNAMRQLPAQVTDIVTGLAGGQKPFQVFIQQGGQLRDSFGSSGAVLRAFASLLSPTRILVGGLAAGIGFLALQAYRGYKEQDRLNKSLILTGDAARASLGQIDGIAQRIATTSGASIGDVRDTLQELVDAGITSATALDGAGRAATAYRKITGASAADASKLFAGQGDAVLDWATKANKAYNFLTAAQLNYIRNLQAQGRDSDAARFANEELAKSLEQRTAPAIGKLEAAWDAVARKVGAVVEATKNLFKPATVDDQIAAARVRLQELEKFERNSAAFQGRKAGESPAITRVKEEIAAMQAAQREDRETARADAVAQAADRQKAFRDSKAFTDALAAVDQAGQQKLLAQRLAAIDKEQSTLQLNRAAQLVSEQDFNQQLNALDQKRLAAQAAALRAQISIEKGRTVESPLDVQAKAAAVTQLEGQLVELQSRIAQAGGKAQELLAADAVDQAGEWEKAWKDAAQRIRQFAADNATTAAGRIADPAARAQAAGQLASADQQRELGDQQRGLRVRIGLTIDPSQAADLQRQLDKLTEQGNQAIGETQRRARFDSLREQLEELTSALSTSEQQIDQAVERGTTSVEEGERRKLAARAASQADLSTILALLNQTADAESRAEQTVVAAARNIALQFQDLRTELQKTARSSAISELAQGLTDIQTGAKSAGSALKDMVLGFARAMLNVINQRLAQQLVDSVLKAVNIAGGDSGGGGWGALIGAVVKAFAGVNHAGGVIGQTSAHAARLVNPAAFAGAQVLHGGGLAGMVSYNDLAPNERRAVLEVGEEVLPEDNPRHIKNFRGGGGVSMQSTFVFNGAQGSEGDQREAAAELERRTLAVVRGWATEQQRQGGLFSRR